MRTTALLQALVEAALIIDGDPIPAVAIELGSSLGHTVRVSRSGVSILVGTADQRPLHETALDFASQIKRLSSLLLTTAAPHAEDTPLRGGKKRVRRIVFASEARGTAAHNTGREAMSKKRRQNKIDHFTHEMERIAREAHREHL